MIDTTGLPEELVNQLSKPKRAANGTLIQIFIEAGKNTSINLDYLLVEYYRRTEKILSRNSLISRLHRMKNAGLIDAVPRLPGVYRLKGVQPRQ